MRSFTNALPIAPFLVAAALAAGCGGGSSGAEQVAPPPEEGTATTAVDVIERQQALDVREQDLRARELAELEQELDEREARLAERERTLARVDERERTLARVDRRDSHPAETQDAPAPSPQPEVVAAAPEATAPEAIDEAPAPVPAPRLIPVTVPAGTALEVELLDALSSATATAGDRFRTRVTGDVIVDGRVGIPAGSIVLGSVTEVVSAKRIGGQARLGMLFDRLELPSGESVALSASLYEEAKRQTKKDAATIGGAAAGGAILGRVLNRDDKTKGTTIGAVVGAAVGTAVAASNQGQEVVIDSGVLLPIQLDEWIRVTLRE